MGNNAVHKYTIDFGHSFLSEIKYYSEMFNPYKMFIFSTMSTEEHYSMDEKVFLNIRMC